MSKVAPPTKHCCCCREHSQRPPPRILTGETDLRSASLPRSVKQSLPAGYNAAAKYLAQGKVMDYTKLNDDFEEASKATCETIMDILHDISSYDIFILERDATYDGRSGCSNGCNECTECSARRRARPDTKDLAHLQMCLRQLFDLIYQNFFHRILCPRKQEKEDAHMALVTPLHRVFILHEQPKYEGWRNDLNYFERHGSQKVILPLKQNERLPKGCPASLCYSASQEVIDEFIDRVLCYTQVLHEKHNSTHHHTTSISEMDDVCPICDKSASWLLPALVAPWFIHRNMMKRETLASLRRSTDITIPTSVLEALKNAPSNYPTFPPPPDPLPTPPVKPAVQRKPKSDPLIEPAAVYADEFLLPKLRPPFEPAQNPDPVRHPYSYFLSLDAETRKKWIRNRAKETRQKLRLEEPSEKEKYTLGPWKCGWFTAKQCGLNARDFILEKPRTTENDHKPNPVWKGSRRQGHPHVSF
ncbi:hypothetical protein BZA77DRAFT_389771 [Pyronema omphalodes]|nr:hypothetical protein BZA77DRAFT_389771 [Pyronema omphalodes]